MDIRLWTKTVWKANIFEKKFGFDKPFGLKELLETKKKTWNMHFVRHCASMILLVIVIELLVPGHS